MTMSEKQNVNPVLFDRLVRVGVPALALLLGVQVLRAMFPLFLFVLRDRVGWTAIQLGELGFVLFLTAFLAGPLSRWLGMRVMLWLTAGGLGLLRLLMQLWTGDPMVDLYLVMGALVLFLWFWPVYVGYTRPGGISHTFDLATGILLGLGLDLALHGAYLTYDMFWRHDLGTLLLTLLPVVGLGLGLWRLNLQPNALRATGRRSDLPLGPAFIWLVFGPYLFLQMVIFQNVARLTSLTGWSLPAAFAWALTAHALGLFFVAEMRELGRWLLPVALAFAVLLLLSLLTAWPTGGLAAGLFLLGQVSGAGLLLVALGGLGVAAPRPGLRNLTVSHGVSGLLFLLLGFVYYSSYDIAIPLPNSVLPPVAGVIVALAALGGVWHLRRAQELLETLPAPGRVVWLPALLLLAGLLLPLGQWLTWPDMGAPAGDEAVRVMNYNLHNGFDIQGHLGLEALAQVIEAENPDIVGLQEVSRGWIVNGSVDMLAWLSRRLGMPYVYGPTADPLWGNALLSRYPLSQVELVALPTEDLLLRRGFIYARADLGDGQYLDVITTHYHHPDDGGPIRLQQTEALLAYWRAKPFTIIMGDMNATPDAPELGPLWQAGLEDAVYQDEVQPGFTYPAGAPDRQIDYIWVTRDLQALDVVIPTATASDHLGIAATIERKDQ